MTVGLFCPLLLFCTVLPVAELSHEMIIQHEKIVKLYDSKDRGARLLGRALAKEQSECSRLCLAKDDCDTAVYHEKTYDRQNCFFLSCGVPNKCVFSDHPDFTVLLRTSADSKELEPVDCELTPWILVTPCSVSCGHGVVIYRRTVVTEAKNGGQPCPGDDQLYLNDSCSLSPCKVDCLLSDWTSFTTCSTSCGPGTRSRYRRILQTSSGGGVNCPPFKSLHDSASCELKKCSSLADEVWGDEGWGGVLHEHTTVVPTDVRERGTKSMGSIAATESSIQSVAEQELDDVISEHFGVQQLAESPSPASSLTSSPSVVVSTGRPSTSPSNNLLNIWEQELNEVATEESDLSDADFALANKDNMEPSQPAHASSSHATQTPLRSSLRVTQIPLTESDSTHQSVVLSEMATSSLAKLNASKGIHLTYGPSVHLSASTETKQSAKPNSVLEYTRPALETTQVLARTDNLVTTEEVGTGGIELDSSEGIEENKGGKSSGTIATAVLVVSLIVGVLFVTASFVLVGRRWYSSFRRRRRYTRMEYLINDVSD